MVILLGSFAIPYLPELFVDFGSWKGRANPALDIRESIAQNQ
ncbi:MAG: hypothetical protein O2951_11090 [Bacteroidetes bacterium]|nr:hypothetical protein [Bacteroidota bacterium]